MKNVFCIHKQNNKKNLKKSHHSAARKWNKMHFSLAPSKFSDFTLDSSHKVGIKDNIKHKKHKNKKKKARANKRKME